MENKINESVISKLVNNNYDKVKKIENISIIIFGLGLVLNLLKLPDTSFILTIGGSLLAICYYVLSFKTSDIEVSENKTLWNSFAFKLFLNKVTYWSLSISVISILFLANNFSQGKTLMHIGLSSLTMVIFFSLITNAKSENQSFNLNLFLKIIIAILIQLYFAITKLNLLNF